MFNSCCCKLLVAAVSACHKKAQRISHTELVITEIEHPCLTLLFLVPATAFCFHSTSCTHRDTPSISGEATEEAVEKSLQHREVLPAI